MLSYLRQSLPGRVIVLLILALGVVNATTVYVFFEERSRAAAAPSRARPCHQSTRARSTAALWCTLNLPQAFSTR